MESYAPIIAAAITGFCALVGAVLALIGVIITVKKSNKELLSELAKRSEIEDQKLDAKLEKFAAVTDEKIADLTREVRKHNNFAERIPVIDTELKDVVRRLDKVEAK